MQRIQLGRSIGGEFELDPALLKTSNYRPEAGRYFSSGRAALHAILKRLKKTHPELLVLIPNYLCRSIVQTLDDLKLPFAFYQLSKDLRVDKESVEKLAKKQPVRKLALLLINYFGLVDCAKDIEFIKGLERDHIVIQDNVQAFFEMGKDSEAEFSFTSFRKTLPTPDGALAKTTEDLGSSDGGTINAFAFHKTISGLIKYLARFDGKNEDIYLDFSRLGEEELDHNKFYEENISPLSLRILGNLDFPEIIERRVSNFRYLQDRLLSIGLKPLVSLEEGEVPLFFPVLIKDRDKVRQALAEARIFCPAHWPLHLHQAELEPAAYLYTNELSIIIDQRYDRRDMDKIAAKLESLNVEMLDNR